MRPHAIFLVLSTAASLAWGCGASSVSGDPATDDAGDDALVSDSFSGDTARVDDVGIDSGSPARDSATIDSGTVVVDSTPPPPSDGAAPRRLPCAARTTLASDLPLDVGGALEGELVSIVPPGTGGACPNDSDHLHLQVEVGTKRYDIAVNVFDAPSGAPLGLLTKDLAAGAAVPLGWSSAARLDFVADLGVHSGEFSPLAKAALLTRLDTELASASSVRIFGRSYTDGTGVHNIHRNGGGHDGAIVVHRGGTDHFIALRFSTDTF